MRVLFDHPNPFLLAHGGLQTQIEQTKLALERNGIEVGWLRWWDDVQRGQIIHYFGRPHHSYVAFAQQKGIRIVIGDLLTGLGSRGVITRQCQRLAIGALRHFSFFDRMAWDAYRRSDALTALTPWEGQLLQEVFGVSPERVHVIPNGVEDVFLQDAGEHERTHWLICTATITPRKKVLELAKGAIRAGTPLWVIGRPYSETDTYYQDFRRLVASHPAILRYEGGVSDRGELAHHYRRARGFVLLSTMESLSLSALEAAACGCPLLLSDLPWARTTFGNTAIYCSAKAGKATLANCLRKFYDSAPRLPVSPQPASWAQVAEQLRFVYEHVLKTSR